MFARIRMAQVVEASLMRGFCTGGPGLMPSSNLKCCCLGPLSALLSEHMLLIKGCRQSLKGLCRREGKEVWQRMLNVVAPHAGPVC